jgi:chemotaxis protein CheC
MDPVLKYDYRNLSDLQLDALKEICNIGMGHAATALNQMIGRAVNLTVPEASVVPLDEIPALLGGPDRIVAGIFLKIWGDFQGNILFVFPQESAAALCTLLTGLEPDDEVLLSEMHASALREIGNILASSFLTALERLLGKTLIPSIPGVAFDMAGAIVDYIIMEVGDVDQSLVIKAAFADPDCGIHGHLYLLPDQTSLRAILEAAQVLERQHRQG